MVRLSHLISNVREHFGAWFRATLILCVLGVLFFVALGGVSHKEKWQINQINVSGTSTESMDIIKSLVRQKLEGRYYLVYAQSNSYIFPKKDIERIILDTFPRLRTALVSRADDHTISVVVEERKPYVLWCGSAPRLELSFLPECWFVDNTGFVFARSPSFSKGVYLEMYGKLTEKEQGEPLRAIIPSTHFALADRLNTLAHAKIGRLMSVEMKNEEEVSAVVLSSDYYPFLSDVELRFNADSEIETLLKNLTAAIEVQFPDNIPLKKKLLYIDMRFGNKVIFGFEE